MSCDLEVTNETAGCWQTISSYITKDDKLLLISALCLYPITVTAAILIWWFNLAFYNHIIWVSFSNIFLKKLSKEFKRDAHNIQMWFIFYMTRHFSDVTKNCNFCIIHFCQKTTTIDWLFMPNLVKLQRFTRIHRKLTEKWAPKHEKFLPENENDILPARHTLYVMWARLPPCHTFPCKIPKLQAPLISVLFYNKSLWKFTVLLNSTW